MRNKWLIILLSIIAIGVGYVVLNGTGQQPETFERSGDSKTNPTVLVGGNAINVQSQSEGDSIVVDFAIFEDRGYVVIHEKANEKPGAIIGQSSYLSQGTSENIQIPLNRPVKVGEELFAMLHNDDGDRIFQTPNDLPTTDQEGNIILMKFIIGEEQEESTVGKVTISSGNFFFQPEILRAGSGELSIRVAQNSGTHTFVIDELGVKESLTAGKTINFTAQPGTYEYYCDVPGHRERGMFGTLTVN